MKDDIIRKKDVNTVKGILWGNSNKIKRFPTDILVYHHYDHQCIIHGVMDINYY
jgi:hypothetical protein